MVSILPLNAFDDNYIWTMYDDQRVVVVDPGQAEPVIDFLKKRPTLHLSAILITHNHYDHVGGVEALVELYHSKVFASWQSNLPLVSHSVKEGMVCEVGIKGCEIIAMEVPGHTKDHVAYVDRQHGTLFCGDTLFGCGCGRIFDSTAEALYDSLQRLARLPEDMQVYAAHEYTLNNIEFAKQVEPDSQDLKKREKAVLALHNRHQPTLPSLMKTELDTNPFLRVEEPVVMASVNNHVGKVLQSPLSVFIALREWKNAS